MSIKEPANEPTKLIKTAGNSGLTRTSQACDRCRIKKIKCDGKIPSCTNCLSIGYNCQTSDKLTRRAFPRGYTENLEKNLISLQNENAKLLTELEALKRTQGPPITSSSSISGASVPVENNTHSISHESTPSIIIPDNSVQIKAEGNSSDPEIPSNYRRLDENFFMFDNFIEKENYVGLNSLNVLFNKMLKSFEINPTQELKFPLIDLHNNNLIDFIITKFLIKFPSKTNLDLLISNHFENLNLIPILDEDLFFKNYKDIFNSIDNKTENLISLLESNSQAGQEEIIIFITKLVIMIQLNCSIFNLHEIHKLVTSLNLAANCSITKFQTALLALYLFHNKNCYKDTVINLTNTSHSMVLSLGLHLNYNNLKQNCSDIQLTREERFKLHSVRLKLYWSFYILSTIASISFGLPQVGFFEKFQIPHLNSILNSNQNLKNCILLIELLKILENVNLLSVNQDLFMFKKIDDDLVNWRKELKLQNLSHQISMSAIVSGDSDQKRPTKRLKKSKILSSHEENTKIQLNLYYIYFRMLLHLQNSYDDTLTSNISQSDYVLSKLSREFLAYIILLDSRKELNNLNNFEFHLIPINFLKMTLVSLLNLAKVSKDHHFNQNSPVALLNDSNDILTKVLKVIKNRYPENFVLFKQIVELIKTEFQLFDPELDSSIPMSSSSTSLEINQTINNSNIGMSRPSSSSIPSNVNDHNSLFFDIDSLTNRNSSIASTESTISTTSGESLSLDYNETDTSSINDHLPDISSNLDLIFDWNTTTNPNIMKPLHIDAQEHDQSVINGVNAYDLNYIVQPKSERL